MLKEISREDFNSFLEILSLVKDNCNDVDISNGVIRQLSNNRTFIFETDISSYIDNVDMILPMIKNKLPLLSIFLDDNEKETIEFGISNNNYTFSDSVTTLNFTETASREHLDNKFIPENEKDNILNIDPNKIIFSQKLNKYIMNKIKIISDQFSVGDIMINVTDGNASFDIQSFNKVQKATIIGNIPTNGFDSGKYRACISVLPFKLDFKNDIDFIMYDVSAIDPQTNESDYKILCQLTTMHDDKEIKIYLLGFLSPL